MILVEIQKRFENAFEKEKEKEKENQKWEKLKTLLFSEDKDSVIQGMNLVESLDEEVYYDGICTFLEDDGSGNWRLKEGLGCENTLSLNVEILRMAEENVGHEIKEGFENGFLEEMFVGVCGEIEVGELSENQQQRLMRKVSEVVEIKSGSFTMGSPYDEENREDREGQHEVELTRHFYMMKYQVTQALWESVCGENPSDFKGASRPVENVSWLDCVLFANKLSEREDLEKVYEIPKDFDVSEYEHASKVKMNLDANGYRLPTEAEWEYAARGGEDYVYAGSDNLDEVGWYTENSGYETHPVGQKKANGFGLYDMSGNVWEWVWDGFGDYPKGSVVDPEGPSSASYRVRRGGSWRDFASCARVADRLGYFLSYRYNRIGVRFSRTLQR